MEPLVGATVEIFGLVAHPELNGSIAEAVEFDQTSNRYLVRLKNATMVKLRPGCLRRIKLKPGRADQPTIPPLTKVTIDELHSRTDLNGTSATVLCWNEEKQRYEVQIDRTLETILLKRGNVREVKPERGRGEWTPEWRTVEAASDIDAREKAALEEQAGENPFADLGLR